MTEFDLIKKYFSTQLEHRADVKVGIGDDAAVVTVPSGYELVITTDTSVAGVHFLVDTPAYDIGYKSLAVNLSDLAAMGANPAWITLSLTMPEANENWIQEFCAGFFTLANRFQVQLIGGDLTKGPLSITIQAMGFVPQRQALLRSTAKPGDLIYVTGTLGDAGLALNHLRGEIELRRDYELMAVQRLHQPEPRIATGLALVGVAHAAIDISDGFAADLNHILAASHVGAKIYVDKLPLSDALTHTLTRENAIALALTAGDDYELCFTLPANQHEKIEKILATIPCRYTCVGEITKNKGLELYYADGKKYVGTTKGFEHFK